MSSMTSGGGGGSLRAVFARLDQRMEEYAVLSERVWGGDTEVGREEVSVAEEGVAGELRRGEELCRAQGSGDAQARNNRMRLGEARAEFERQRRRMREGLERRELFSGVTQERRGETTIAMDDLMRERGHIRESGRVADEILEQAAEAADALQRQQQMVAGTRGKLGVFDSVVRSAGDVIGKIKWQRRKNGLVTAVTIALCLFFLFWWWWS